MKLDEAYSLAAYPEPYAVVIIDMISCRIEI